MTISEKEMHINKTKQNGKKQFHHLTCQVAANINMLMFLDTFIRAYAHSYIYLQNTYEKHYFAIVLFHLVYTKHMSMLITTLMYHFNRYILYMSDVSNII